MSGSVRRFFNDRKMKSALITITLLIVSNIFMTFAWYGHLKLQDTKVITSNTQIGRAHV